MHTSGSCFVFPHLLRLVFLVVVSNIMIAYTLNKNIAIEQIAKDLQKLLNNKSPEELSNKVLIIKLEDVNNYSGDSLLAKITYDPNLSHPI